MELLEKRMKACFTELLTFMENAPANLHSGRGSNNPSSSRKASFIKKANALFCAKGLAFFSSDLAVASWNARRVIEVAIQLYDNVFLEPILNTL
mmetsp:Transcript_2874/g.3854  ORF Transcript_2874/g.3854 Transcript_2874/m.3854 type:complete len:94 (-) Transcript_2874:381-662(-)